MFEDFDYDNYYNKANMEYSIVTSNPLDLRYEILDCVKNGQDLKGGNISTWVVRIVNFNIAGGKTKKETILVHDTDAWRDVGCIQLVPDENGNSKLYARFFYWNSFPAKDRDGSHELYLFGRLSELLLVHFMDKIRAIHIVK